MNQLEALLQSLPNYALITSDMKQAALNSSLIPDSAGVWPGGVGYELTYDVYHAAGLLLPFLMAQPTVTSASSEGTSISTTPMDWSALKESYRLLSPIAKAVGLGVLNVVDIPENSHVVRVPMRDGGGYYGDVDTDVN
jgi:hypothetical protein